MILSKHIDSLFHSAAESRCVAHRQLKRQLKLFVLKELLDLFGYGHWHQAPHKMVAGNIHNILPEKDMRSK